MAAASANILGNANGAAAVAAAIAQPQPPAQVKKPQTIFDVEHFPNVPTFFTHEECERIRKATAKTFLMKESQKILPAIVLGTSPEDLANRKVIIKAVADARAKLLRDKISALNAANPNAFNFNPATPVDAVDDSGYDTDVESGYDTDYVYNNDEKKKPDVLKNTYKPR